MSNGPYEEGFEAGYNGEADDNPYEDDEPFVGPTLDALGEMLGADYDSARKAWDAGYRDGKEKREEEEE